MYLGDGQLFELQIQPSYKVGQTEVDMLLSGMSGLKVWGLPKEIEAQKRIIKEKRKTLCEQDQVQVDDYLSNLELLSELDGALLDFVCSYESNGLPDVYSEQYTAQVLELGDTVLRTTNAIRLFNTNLSNSKATCVSGEVSRVYQLDYRRLLDWLAFDIGHYAYDSDEFTNKMVDSYLGMDGLYFTANNSKVEDLVPKNFMRDLYDLGIDFSNKSVYIKNAKQATNYYGHEVSKKTKKVTTFSDLLYMQNSYTLDIVLVYVRRLATKLGVPVKLLGIGTGLIDIAIGSVYNEDKFIQELKQGCKVRLFDMRSFMFTPCVHYIDTKED